MDSPFIENLLFAMIVGLVLGLPVTLTIGIIVHRIRRRKKPSTLRTISMNQIAPFVLLFVALVSTISYFLFGMDWWMCIILGVVVVASLLFILFAFSGHQIVSNITSGITMVLMKNIRVGDFVEIPNSFSGYVEAITLIHTVIRDRENVRIIIPNHHVFNHSYMNHSYGDQRICRFIRFSISYESDVELALHIIREVADACPQLIKPYGHDKVKVEVEGYGDSCVEIRAWCWCMNVDEALELEWYMNKHVKRRFDQEGIVIPFPQRTVHMRQLSR